MLLCHTMTYNSLNQLAEYPRIGYINWLRYTWCRSQEFLTVQRLQIQIFYRKSVHNSPRDLDTSQNVHC